MLLPLTTNQLTHGHWFRVDGVADDVCEFTTGVSYWLLTDSLAVLVHMYVHAYILFVGVNLCVGLIYFKSSAAVKKKCCDLWTCE